ncbi:hypothetical protein P7B02_08715 [Caulobacter segnis]|uniref:hypothetical protein n=1 Tax=Caulobacter segnis TaxID=88688 RepID=UPI00241028F7|nr:hypothetical protein [Caulobacter segnis]MDG2521623.1 hypothetical protein [Caulobacter segnis]
MIRTYRAALGGLVFYDAPERRRSGRLMLAMAAGGVVIAVSGGIASQFMHSPAEKAAPVQVAQTEAPLSYLPQ